MFNYLKDRQQFATINGVESDIKHIKYGVPQGSILGPLLFLIYINDLGKVSDRLSMILFADDTNIFATGKDLDLLTSTLNEEMEKLFTWLKANRLSLNVKKTHYMVFNPKPRSNAPPIDLFINKE